MGDRVPVPVDGMFLEPECLLQPFQTATETRKRRAGKIKGWVVILQSFYLALVANVSEDKGQPRGHPGNGMPVQRRKITGNQSSRSFSPGRMQWPGKGGEVRPGRSA
jgi:hypothetical protein